MMLYDRVVQAMSYRSRKGFRPKLEDRDIGARLLGATVYEISNVTPLFDDWERDRTKPIPKRAPHTITWCEWREEEVDPTGTSCWRVGALISEVPHQDMFEHLRHAKRMIPETPVAAWQDRIVPGDLIYTIQPFKLLESSTFPDDRSSLFQPCVGVPANIFAFRATGEYVGSSMVFPNAYELTHDEFAEKFSIFGLTVLASFMEDRFSPLQCYWPPFMAFSLMHCKNVSVDVHQPDAKSQRSARRSHSPPRSSWRTISICVPETLKSKQPGSATESDASSVRFHLCRGHFKNLQHPRFKNPGLHWWPAHWRGDPELGTVITDRVLKTNE